MHSIELIFFSVNFWYYVLAQHCHMKLCSKVWKAWITFLQERQFRFSQIAFNHLRYIGICTVLHWKNKQVEAMEHLWRQERRALIIGRRILLRWAICRWASGAAHSRKERYIEEKVAEKWEQVRKWLQ